jgi:hypothetical protein
MPSRSAGANPTSPQNVGADLVSHVPEDCGADLHHEEGSVCQPRSSALAVVTNVNHPSLHHKQ